MPTGMASLNKLFTGALGEMIGKNFQLHQRMARVISLVSAITAITAITPLPADYMQQQACVRVGY